MSGDTLLLGIDVGTQSSKGALVTLDGRVVAHHAVEHEVEPAVPRLGRARRRRRLVARRHDDYSGAPEPV